MSLPRHRQPAERRHPPARRGNGTTASTYPPRARPPHRPPADGPARPQPSRSSRMRSSLCGPTKPAGALMRNAPALAASRNSRPACGKPSRAGTARRPRALGGIPRPVDKNGGGRIRRESIPSHRRPSLKGVPLAPGRSPVATAKAGANAPAPHYRYRYRPATLRARCQRLSADPDRVGQAARHDPPAHPGHPHPPWHAALRHGPHAW